MFKQKSAIAIIMAGLLVLGIAAPGFSDDTVVVVPGYVEGTISLGGITINQANVRTSGSSASFNTSTGKYMLTVNTPENGSQEYKISGAIYTDNRKDRMNFKDYSVTVSDGETVPLDININPGIISGQVSVNGCTLKNGSISAYLDAEGNYTSAGTSIGSDGKFSFPAQPNGGVKVSGYVYTTGGRFDLEKFVDLFVGSTTVVNWNIECEHQEPAESGSVSGNFYLHGLEGTGNILDRHSVGIKENGPYSLTNLSPGKRYFTAESYLNNGDDTFRHPYTNYIRNLTIVSGENAINNVNTHAAFANGKVILSGSKGIQDVQSATIYAGGISETPTSGGNSTDKVDVSNGNYDMVLSEGDWKFHHAKFAFRENDTENYLNSSLDIYDYRGDNNISLDKGEVINNHDLEYEVGTVTVRFKVKGGGTLKSPSLSGTCNKYDESGQREMQATIRAYGLSDETTEGKVRYVGIPGTYNLTASALVNGSRVNFGKLDVEIFSGTEIIIDIDGPDTKTYTISGHVRTPGGMPVQGVILSGLPGNPVTDVNGFYRVTGTPQEMSTVAPEKADHLFEPATRSYNEIETDLSDQDYTATDLLLICNAATIESVRDGNWNAPGTWNTGTVPTSDDIVRIASSHSVTASRTPINVGSVCNFGTLRSSQTYSLELYATNLIYNKGAVHGADGKDGRCSDADPDDPDDHGTCNNGTDIDESRYVRADLGSSVILTAGKGSGSANGTIYNAAAGDIQAGRGGHEITYLSLHNDFSCSGMPPYTPYEIHATGRDGGKVRMYAAGNVVNAGKIGPEAIINSDTTPDALPGENVDGGNGGAADNWNHGTSWISGNASAGNGGDTSVVASGTLVNTSTGRISSGNGGYAEKSQCLSDDAEVVPGTGGKATTSAPKAVNLGEVLGGNNGSVRWDPGQIATTRATRIHGAKEVIISNGESRTFDLGDLSADAVSADETITIALGPGAILDLRGISENAFKAGKQVNIFADKILLDKGVRLSDIFDTPHIATGGSEALYDVVLFTPQKVRGELGSSVSVDLLAFNNGPTADTYDVTVTDSKGWELGSLPSSIAIGSLTEKMLSLDIFFPSVGDETEDLITITLTSQSDQKVIASGQVLAVTEAEDDDDDIPEPVPGGFAVLSNGMVQVDWLYDGGMYKGELGMFSLRDMDLTVPDLTAFITEAVTRVLSDTEDGHIVLSDETERAREFGTLSGEPTDWNEGEYNHAKSLSMRSGDQFALVLVPNGTFEALSQNPGTENTYLRPLFSLVSPNADYGMHTGQVADVNGMGLGFVFEDMEFTNSDKDYNDLIIQISGAVPNVPSIDMMIGVTEKAGRSKQSRKDWYDWRVSDELGRKIMEHLGALPTEDDQWLSVTFDGSSEIRIYDAQDRFTGTLGTDIPGSLRFTENGKQVVTLPAIGFGRDDYRIMLHAVEDEIADLIVTSHLGWAEISSDTKQVGIDAHQVLRSDLSASPDDGLNVDFAEPDVPRATDGTLLLFDFDGDGNIDDEDIGKVSSRWNTCEGDPEWNPAFDLDGDGYIGILDIMLVVNSKTDH